MNPVQATSANPVFPAFAGTASPFQAGYPQARFGMAAAGRAGAESAKRLGKFATMRALGKYYVAGQNKEAIKALFWQYGIPALFGLSFLIPVLGWAVGLAGLAVIPFAIRKGKRLREKLELSGTKGPFARISEITREYEKATDYKNVKSVKDTRGFAPTITAKIRDFVDELFPDQDDKQIKNLQKAVNGLKPTEGGRVEKLIGNGLHVQFEYRNKWQGRLLRSLNRGLLGKTVMRIPVLKLPFIAMRFLLIGALMITNRKMLQQAFKTVA